MINFLPSGKPQSATKATQKLNAINRLSASVQNIMLLVRTVQTSLSNISEETILYIMGNLYIVIDVQDL